MTDFIVLTGFLGSGKTSLLADFLQLPEAADTAIIVNEIGEIGLDGAILAESGGVPIAMLANGCICCALAGDLEPTVAALVAARRGGPPLARIILETSGLSKPGPILRSLTGLAPLGLRVGVVATFDCRGGPDMAAFEEAAAQWAGAQTLVLTKRDIASRPELSAARELAAGVNPLAALVDTDDRAAAVRAAFSLHAPATRLTPFPVTASGRHPRIQVLLARPREGVLWDDIAEWLDNLAGRLGDRLLRVKGAVRAADRPHPMLVQSVGTLFSAPRPFVAAPGEGSFLIVITRDADAAELRLVAPPVLAGLAPFGDR